MTLYQLRVVERLWGSRKFAVRLPSPLSPIRPRHYIQSTRINSQQSKTNIPRKSQSFILVTLPYTAILPPLLLAAIIRPLSLNTANYLPAGPTALVFALLAQYHAAIPYEYKYRVGATDTASHPRQNSSASTESETSTSASTTTRTAAAAASPAPPTAPSSSPATPNPHSTSLPTLLTPPTPNPNIQNPLLHPRRPTRSILHPGLPPRGRRRLGHRARLPPRRAARRRRPLAGAWLGCRRAEECRGRSRAKGEGGAAGGDAQEDG